MSRSPTLEVLLICTIVFIIQSLIGVFSAALATGLFALAPPFVVNPWGLITSVYAHSGVGHYTANMIALVLFGLLVERRTTRARFHVFFLSVGVLAGVSEVFISGVIGGPAGVIGASGAIFGLLGYLLAGNIVSQAVFRSIELSGRAQFGLFVVIALLVTIATGRPGVALIAHFTGLILGLLAGYIGLLDVRQPVSERPIR
ncbi:rhomboid family intramembrane serine protease [Natronocalculus amylovorans]|uniref:Rhomboid family intramembrane serine protease n=1 Tax=Natronocalculus amylovorans TaxID=2917812 RepID=A0AAE3K756_9EURY|nr:rhomboid family intramembrane serine protease [Natronocalculus amylovorans]MCL9815681.1 rhomboid family intramembrane serine protease [Natronocalculus amylovorans]NUE01806.1 rhomboid family intramembrane serine protease [Halorubraceae archaeon YAN]